MKVKHNGRERCSTPPRPGRWECRSWSHPWPSANPLWSHFRGYGKKDGGTPPPTPPLSVIGGVYVHRPVRPFEVWRVKLSRWRARTELTKKKKEIRTCELGFEIGAPGCPWQATAVLGGSRPEGREPLSRYLSKGGQRGPSEDECGCSRSVPRLGRVRWHRCIPSLEKQGTPKTGRRYRDMRAIGRRKIVDQVQDMRLRKGDKRQTRSLGGGNSDANLGPPCSM